MFNEPADAGDRSADVTPELADQLCVLLGGKPSANAGRRAGLANPAESPRTPCSTDSPGIAASRCIADSVRYTNPGNARLFATTRRIRLAE